MKRRVFVASAAVALTPAFTGRPMAQVRRTPTRVGWVTAQHPPSVTPFIEAFRDGLSDVGYIEGRNIAIDFRYGNDEIARVPELVADLMRDGLDVLVVQGTALFHVRNLNLTVPIVYAISSDPVSAGLADTLARPRGNMTGVTLMAVELNGKRLELLREIVPGLRRVTIVGNPEHPGAHIESAFSEQSAKRLGLTIDYRPSSTRAALASVLAAMESNPPQAISILADGFAIQNRHVIIDFAMRHRAPAISGWPIFARSGAICTFGPRIQDSHRRLAHYVDQIIKGAKPADLPIERPTKFELVLNQRVARALRLSIPQSLMASADEVIE